MLIRQLGKMKHNLRLTFKIFSLKTMTSFCNGSNVNVQMRMLGDNE
jgi:hypothetical protein